MNQKNTPKIHCCRISTKNDVWVIASDRQIAKWFYFTFAVKNNDWRQKIWIQVKSANWTVHTDCIESQLIRIKWWAMTANVCFRQPKKHMPPNRVIKQHPLHFTHVSYFIFSAHMGPSKSSPEHFELLRTEQPRPKAMVSLWLGKKWGPCSS